MRSLAASAVIVSALIAASAAHAQETRKKEPPPRLRPPARGTSWEAGWRARADLRYDSNVFQLDPKDEDRLEAGLPADDASGRHDDMESVDDEVLAPRLRFEARDPSPLGRRLDAWAELEYEQYVENPRRSHAEASLGVQQGLGARGRIGLELDLSPRTFQKNYLADGIDADGDGDVSASERVYRAALYREVEARLDYRHEIVPRGAAQPFGLDGVVAIGWRDQDFNAAFDGRDESGPSLALELRFGWAKTARWSVGWRLEEVSSPAATEVRVFDEPEYGMDFNGDGDALDNNIRRDVRVDRSHRANRFGGAVEVTVAPGVDVELSYWRVRKAYTSDEPLDFSNRGREDDRHEIGLAVKFAIDKGWDARIGWQRLQQDTDRPADPNATETLDYERDIVTLSVTAKW
jgi:hypothetical protein